MEKKIEADHFEQIATNGGNMTVLELVEKYTSTKTGVRPTTVAGYGTAVSYTHLDVYKRQKYDYEIKLVYDDQVADLQKLKKEKEAQSR